MTTPSLPSNKSPEQVREAKKAILDKKLLSYLPLEGWGYRTMDEITEGKEDEETR